MNVQSVAMSGKKIVAHMRESLGILLKKGLIFPILIQRRKAHTEIVGFSIVAVCQMRDEAIHPASLWELEHLAFFISKKHRRTT